MIFRLREPTYDYQYRALHSRNPIQRYWHYNKVHVIKNLVQINRDDVILDAGCGSGIFVEEFNKNNNKIIALDMDFNALRFVKSRQGLSNVRVINSRIEALPLIPNFIDKIYCLDAIEHMDKHSYTKALEEFYRVLKPGSLLILTTPNYHSLWLFVEGLISIIKLTFGIKPDRHRIRFNYAKLKKSILQEKFRLYRGGYFNLLSPFLAIISKRLADRYSQIELRKQSKWSNMIYMVFRKI